MPINTALFRPVNIAIVAVMVIFAVYLARWVKGHIGPCETCAAE